MGEENIKDILNYNTKKENNLDILQKVVLGERERIKKIIKEMIDECPYEDAEGEITRKTLREVIEKID